VAIRSKTRRKTNKNMKNEMKTIDDATKPERMTPEERFKAIKNKTSGRTDEELIFAGSYIRERDARVAAEKATITDKYRNEFVEGNTPTTKGKLLSSLRKTQRFGDKYAEEIGGKIEELVNQNWGAQLNASANWQLTNGKVAYGTTAIGKVGMDYARFITGKKLEMLKSRVEQNAPVNAVAVEAYGIKLPEGWTERDGLLYPPTAVTPTAPAATSGDAEALAAWGV